MDTESYIRYRELRKQCLKDHPDRGGSGELFKQFWPEVQSLKTALEASGAMETFNGSGIYGRNGLAHIRPKPKAMYVNVVF